MTAKTRQTARHGRALGLSVALMAACVPLALDRPVGAVLALAALCVVAAWISVEDLAFFRIADIAIAAAAALGFAARYAVDGIDGMVWALVGGLAVFGGAAGFAAIYAQARGFEGLGFGDVKLLGASGVWLGVDGVPFQLILAGASALAFVAVRLWVKRRAWRARMRIPFGAFLAPALPIVWAASPWLP